jgi:hypothetical protein
VLAPALTKEDELHWLALCLIPGLGTRKAGQLIERYQSPRAIFRASRSELESRGLAGSVAQTIASGCTFDDAVEQQQKMLETGAVLVPISDATYPARLREIFDPPIVLFARGKPGSKPPPPGRKWDCLTPRKGSGSLSQKRVIPRSQLFLYRRQLYGGVPIPTQPC